MFSYVHRTLKNCPNPHYHFLFFKIIFPSGPEDTSWLGYFNRAVSTTASYLPTQVTDTLNQARAVATVSVPPTALPHVGSAATNTVALAEVSRQIRVLLASVDGYLYIYNLPGQYIYIFIVQ